MDAVIAPRARVALDQRRASWAAPAVLAALIGMAVAGGAYDLRARTVAAVACIAGAGLLATIRPTRRALVGLFALGAPLIVSAAANGWPQGWHGDAMTIAIAVSVAAVARTLDARRMIELVSLASGVCAAVGIAGVALHIQPWGIAADPWRIGAGLGYQNAAGALFTIGFLASATLTAARHDGQARVLTTLNAVALIGTMSRGAGLAALIATIVLVRTVDVDKRPLGWALVGCVALAPSMLGLPAGGALTIIGVAGATALSARRAPEPGRIAVIGACIALCVVGIAAASALGTRPAGTSNQRLAVWGATLDAMDHDLLVGTGPGTYRLIRVRDGQVVTTRHAHNEFLEVLSEQGVVGLIGFAVAVGLMAWSVAAATPGAQRSLALAVIVAIGVHASLDFILHIPAVVAMAAAVVGSALGRRSST